MRKIIFLSSILFVSFLLAFNTSAQDKVIHGMVTTFDSFPLIGANIKIQSTNITVLSDTLGNFSAECNNKDKLFVTADGFFSQKVKLKKNTKFAAVNLNLKSGEKNKELAIGYGSISDRDKMNALASANSNEVDFSRYSNMYELIKGRFAGVRISGGNVIIRGTNSINSGSGALIVVNGIQNNSGVLRNISPVNVKSISLIKDGGAAIYGARATNGVIIIETKR